MILDHAIDDDDEGAGRPTDLHPAAARRRDDEAADDRGHQSDEGRAARRDGDRDAQRQRDQRDADPGQGIGAEQRPAVIAHRIAPFRPTPRPYSLTGTHPSRYAAGRIALKTARWNPPTPPSADRTQTTTNRAT